MQILYDFSECPAKVWTYGALCILRILQSTLVVNCNCMSENWRAISASNSWNMLPVTNPIVQSHAGIFWLHLARICLSQCLPIIFALSRSFKTILLSQNIEFEMVIPSEVKVQIVPPTVYIWNICLEIFILILGGIKRASTELMWTLHDSVFFLILAEYILFWKDLDKRFPDSACHFIALPSLSMPGWSRKKVFLVEWGYVPCSC